ncbi:MAG: IS21 family transposase [Thermoanaerobaculaceae bacterium]|nr:IS21 family transposase [Thermoanaerobaculaceae bacterium]
MSNVLSDEKRQQVVALGRLGWPLRRIEAVTGVRRETASGYLRAAGVQVAPRGRRPSKPAISEGVSTDFSPVNAAAGGVAAGLADVDVRPSRAPSASACEAFRGEIVRALGLGRNAKAIWQDLVDDHGFTARYASVKRFVSKLRTGKYRRTRLFVMTLGYSRKAVRLLVWRSGAQTWAELHEQSFRRLGGTVKVVVLDNLREGVLAPDIYDPALNPLYRDVLAHYGVVALPCRIGDPDRKGKVESGIGHTQRTPLKGLRFESLEEAQRYLDRWEEHWADTRIHGTTKRQVGAMFAEEKPYLGELPLEPFRYYRYGERTVNLDGCAEVEAAYYGAPPGWIGRKVLVQWDGLHVRLLDPRSGKLLREHLVQRRGHHRIKDEDRPSRTPRSTEALLHRARTAGPHIGLLCERIHRSEGVLGVRRILGVLSLARKHGAAALDEAAKAALELDLPNYRFVRRYLDRRPAVPLTLRQVDPLIRQLTLYRELIDKKTGVQA